MTIDSSIEEELDAETFNIINRIECSIAIKRMASSLPNSGDPLHSGFSKDLRKVMIYSI